MIAPAIAVAGQSSPGGITIRLLDASVARENDPRARLYIDDHVAADTTIIRHIDVRNTTTKPLPLHYYAVAAKISGGSFNILAGRTANDLTGWTIVVPSESTINPGAAQTLTVTIKVPHGVTPGERYAAVVADYEPPRSSSSTVAQGSRVGIRIYLSVGSGPEPTSNFSIDTLTAGRDARHRPYVRADVRNTGQRALDIAGNLRLANGPGGVSAGPFPTSLGSTLAPGQREPVYVYLSKDLPSGPWRARMDLASGDVKRAAQGTIRFPDASSAASAPVKAKAIPLTKNRDVVIPVAIGVLLAALILFLLILWRRRRRDDDGELQPAVAQ
jgi:hypothetical protein